MHESAIYDRIRKMVKILKRRKKMGYCPKCGADVGDAAFCHNCGNQITETLVEIHNTGAAAVQMQQSIRQESLDQATKVYEYFKVKEKSFIDYEKIQEKLAYYQGNNKTVMIVFGWIFAAIALSLIFGQLISIPLQLSEYSFDFSSFMVTLCCTGVPVLIFGVLAIVFLTTSYKWEHTKKKEVPELQDLLLVYEKDLNEHYEAYGVCPVGIEYSDPRILEVLVSNIKSGRADTIKESIAIMMDDAHKTAMELNSRMAADAAGAAAAFSAASFFLK